MPVNTTSIRLPVEADAEAAYKALSKAHDAVERVAWMARALAGVEVFDDVDRIELETIAAFAHRRHDLECGTATLRGSRASVGGGAGAVTDPGTLFRKAYCQLVFRFDTRRQRK